MSAYKHIDRICCIILCLTLIVTVLFMNGKAFGIKEISTTNLKYEDKLFDTTKVHTIDIVMDDWESFLDSCENEEYSVCAVVIDNKSYKNVGIRAKGNTSLSSVAAYGNNRYSFKIEFDHYDSSKSYYGLDKLSLNNIIQDNTYMKDYLSYQMMGYFGADSPLCSYVYITVNGEDWGLYLAVEGVEESFLERNYGTDYGELYKPDSMSMGGGRGNGGGFDMDDFKNNQNGTQENNQDQTDNQTNGMPQMPGNNTNSDSGGNGMPSPPDMQNGNMPSGGNMPGGGKMDGGMVRGSSDVSLIYSDDDYDSYSNIFDNAKTDITNKDKKRLISSLKQLNENSNIKDIVNVEEVIRYFVVHNFVCNFDSYTGSMIHNYYLYEKDGQLSMIPWDYNLAFGGFQSSDATSLVNYPIDTPVSGGTVDSRPMLAWIFADEEYTELYHQYFQEFIDEYFDSGHFEDMITSVKAMISPYVEKDPTKFCTYEEFEKGIDTLKEFCLLRAESINGQLEGTIPSTSDGQTADTSSLIDASAVTITDMGSMGNTMGHGGMNNSQQPNQGNGQQGMPQGNGNTQSTDGTAPTQQTPPDNSQQGMPQGGMPQGGGPQGGMKPPSGWNNENGPQGNQQGGQMPGNMQGDSAEHSGQASSMNSNTWILFGASVLVLVAGVIFAARYRRRRG